MKNILENQDATQIENYEKNMHSNLLSWFLGILLVISSAGILIFRKPVHASLSFLLTLMTLAALYMELSAQFIAIMQIIVYAGAILVIFMYVIVLFQDVHMQITRNMPLSSPYLLWIAKLTFIAAFTFLGLQILGFDSVRERLPIEFGTVESLGKLLYINFFFPFEAIVFIFLISIVGSLYIAKKER